MIRYLNGRPEFFDRDTIQIMSDALDEAWQRVQASGARFDKAKPHTRYSPSTLLIWPAKANGTLTV